MKRLLIILLVFLGGCATRPPVTYNYSTRNWDLWAIDDRPVNETDTVKVEVVEPFTIVVMPLDELNDLWDKKYPEDHRDVLGFIEGRTIYVPWERWRWDRDGFPLPVLETLGHELWHLPELGGWWHD